MAVRNQFASLPAWKSSEFDIGSSVLWVLEDLYLKEQMSCIYNIDESTAELKSLNINQ